MPPRSWRLPPAHDAQRRERFVTCLIYVAAIVLPVLVASSARADAPARVIKGPYLQALGSTSVEVRAELDAPAAVVVKVAGVDDGGAHASHDDVAGTMHVVRIEGLRPATRYSYALTLPAAPAGTEAASGWKGEFTTAPESSSKGPFSFLVYGDNRTDVASHAAIVRAMLELPTDFIVNTGDLVQDGASDPNWQSFFDVEAPLLRSRNVFSCVGNHEVTDGAGVNYLRYFGPTYDAHGGGKPKLYGSFRWANTRFFLLDAFESFESSLERAWLDDELARADAEPGLTWRIVVMHQSPWSAGPHGGSSRALRAGIPELLAAHHVDLVLAGHDHIYERGLASGVRYVISGGGGAPLYEVEHRLASTRKVEAVHHVIVFTVDGDSARLVTKRDDGSVLERCGMAKGHDGWDCDPPPAAAAKSDSPASLPTPPAKHGCSVTRVVPRDPVTPAAPFSLVAAFGLAALRRRRRRHAGHGC
jgi:MYXO-CTERM domain-containing protein